MVDRYSPKAANGGRESGRVGDAGDGANTIDAFAFNTVEKPVCGGFVKFSHRKLKCGTVRYDSATYFNL
jgi:hypothetical protein